MLGRQQSSAYAIAITEENIFGIIRSEAGPKFDIELALTWLQECKEGWFLRDETSPLDCQFFVPEIFTEIYQFTKDDQNLLIRHVELL